MPVVPTLRPLKTLPTLEMECVSPSLSLSSKLRPNLHPPSLFGSFLRLSPPRYRNNPPNDLSLSLSQKFCVSFFSAISDRCINIYIVSRFGESFFFWKIVDKGNI